MPHITTKKKTILITGCSTGIGFYCAKTLHQQGYQVIATARKEKDIKKLKQLGLYSLQLDLNHSHSIQQAIHDTLDITQGSLYALFNNGAYGQAGAVEDLSRDVLRQQFETNLFGTQELTNLVVPIMRQQGYGRIIHNSSVLGLVALAFRGAYNASKYALEGLADTQRLELRGTNIYISLIEPGPILSDFRKNSLKALQNNINIQDSVYAEQYQKTLERLQKEGAAVPFTLPPDAVYKKLLHALENKHPKARYYVTFPTYLFGFLRRILSTKRLDKILAKI